MIRRIGKRKYNIFAFDLESHNDEESLKAKETCMWLGCLINEDSKINDEDIYFYSMDEFLNKIQELTKRKRNKQKTRLCNNLCIYIYNLSFEWSFILPVLLKRGFKYKNKINKDDEFVFNSVSTKSVSSVWQAELKFDKNNGFILFKDLAKMFGGGLGKVAKSFNLETQKGEIDYRLNRLHGHIVTNEEKEYVFKDTRIIVDILLKLDEEDDKDFFKTMSMASYSMIKLLEYGYKNTYKKLKEYRKDYPTPPHEETQFLRNSVSGGLTFVNPIWQYKEIKEKICHVDAHSMHPSSAYLNRFPFGKGEYHQGQPTNFGTKINCCHVRISYYGVKLHSIIKLIGIDFIDNFELWIWDFEIPTMKKCYENLEIEYIDYYSYSYKYLSWRKFYKAYFDKRIEAKKRNDSYNYLRNKLIINSSYGKSLEKGHINEYENFIDENGIIDSKIIQKTKNDKQTDEQFIIQCENSKYTALEYGSCIPAYSRVSLIEHALKIGYENVIYVDTDSIFFIWNDKTKKAFYDNFNLNNELGGWAIEEFLNEGMFTAPKRYKTLNEDNQAIFKIGGFNLLDLKTKIAKERGQNVEQMTKDEISKVIVPYEEVNIISSKWKVQRAFRCKGGTLIDFQEKELDVNKKYLAIYNKNAKIKESSD